MMLAAHFELKRGSTGDEARALLIDAAPNQNIEIEVSNEWPWLALWAITFGFRRYLTPKRLPVANTA